MHTKAKNPPFLWISDPHFLHLTGDPILRLENINPSYLLLGGDYMHAPSVNTFFKYLSEAAIPYAAVLGNHDFYQGSIETVRRELQPYKEFLFEPTLRQTPIEFDAFSLVGTGGWGDSTEGSKNPFGLSLNDEVYIQELRHTKDTLGNALQKLGEEHAQYLKKLLEETTQDNILILTHVPPWPRATWHLGKQSSPHGLARFCWGQGGKIILEYHEKFPHKNITVLSGHCHGQGKIFLNGRKIACYTSGAEYGKFQISGKVFIQPNKKITVKEYK